MNISTIIVQMYAIIIIDSSIEIIVLNPVDLSQLRIILKCSFDNKSIECLPQVCMKFFTALHSLRCQFSTGKSIFMDDIMATGII